MKQEQVKDALYSAFDNYWKANNQITIDGELTNISTKTEHLYFNDSCIILLTQAIGYQDDWPKLTGKLNAYKSAKTPEDSKSIRLKFTIRNTDYQASYDKESNKVNICFQNIVFQNRIV